MQIGAGVCIYCPKTGRFLLQKRGPNITDPNMYDWFGGGVDDGEDILTGGVRELAEEGGINIEPESLYPLARYGYEPSQGLGGYHIWLLVVADEFKAIPAFDGDTNDEVVRCDWITGKDVKNIKLHDRVMSLFSDPEFPETMKHAVNDRINTGHIAKINNNE